MRRLRIPAMGVLVAVMALFGTGACGGSSVETFLSEEEVGFVVAIGRRAHRIALRHRARCAGRRSARRDHDSRRPRGGGRSRADGRAGASARCAHARSQRHNERSRRGRPPGASGLRRVGTGRRLARRRRARCAAAEREGSRVRLGWRPRDREVSRAGSHARDGVGSGDGHPDAGHCRHRLQHLLQRAGPSH